MTNGRCVECVTGISVGDSPCERGTEVKRENKERGVGGGGSGDGKRQSAREQKRV